MEAALSPRAANELERRRKSVALRCRDGAYVPGPGSHRTRIQGTNAAMCVMRQYGHASKKHSRTDRTARVRVRNSRRTCTCDTQAPTNAGTCK
jgi:hypothetical protein